jgi:thiosulfate dehydrogenase
MSHRLTWVAGFFTLAVYAAAIFAGLKVHDLSGVLSMDGPPVSEPWAAPKESSIPRGHDGDSIRLGQLIFNETPLFAAEHTGARISCSSCHAEGGIQKYASPVFGAPSWFPMYQARAGRKISLEDRIQECFVRSENGRPLDFNGVEMKAVVSYIQWLSVPMKNGATYTGRGLVDLPDLKPNLERGAKLYAAQCAGCHGDHGQGIAPMFPAVWGADSFNDGAGMNGVRKMAAFVQHNMPQNRMGILSPQEAYDVANFIHNQPRPAFNKAFARY